ncbi:MAG TPA: hypothetical protein VGF13_01195 [Verrucomicrobiae bacterium]|jgi:hypothetical protein
MTVASLQFLTCPQRQETFTQTLARLARTDWGAWPRIHIDDTREEGASTWGTSARAPRLTYAFAAMLREALAEKGRDEEWLLLLEDDLDFHPKIAAHVAAWGALKDPRSVMASLFNPSLQAIEYPDTPAQAFAANPKTFLGAQALLLRRGAVRRAVAEWDQLSGMQSQRLAKLFGQEGPIWVHKPSLVQHVAVDSSWGVRIQRALDFNPAWEP